MPPRSAASKRDGAVAKSAEPGPWWSSRYAGDAKALTPCSFPTTLTPSLAAGTGAGVGPVEKTQEGRGRGGNERQPQNVSHPPGAAGHPPCKGRPPAGEQGDPTGAFVPPHR